jgi:hypothetical protein
MNSPEEGEARFYTNAYSLLDNVGANTPDVFYEGDVAAPKVVHPHTLILRYFADQVNEEEFGVILYLHSLEYDITKKYSDPASQQSERMRQFKRTAILMSDYGHHFLNSAVLSPSNN